MQAVTKLSSFELTTLEEVMRATEVVIQARLTVTNDGLILAVDEAPIKSLLENIVGACVTMKPRGEAEEVAEDERLQNDNHA